MFLVMSDLAPSPNSIFPQTRWTLVLRARADEKDDAALSALGELLRAYWQPLYVFARQSGVAAADAEDAVQSFCHSLIHRESLRTADRDRGRLRSFLLSGFQNHLRSLHRDQQRQKRQGAAEMMSLEDAEALLELNGLASESPDRAFEKRWAYTLLERVLQRLRAEYAERGQEQVLALLEPTLVWNGSEMGYEVLADKLGLTSNTVAQKVKRLRLRYRALLELEIGDTVDSTESIAEERDYLIRVLSGS